MPTAPDVYALDPPLAPALRPLRTVIIVERHEEAWVDVWYVNFPNPTARNQAPYVTAWRTSARHPPLPPGVDHLPPVGESLVIVTREGDL